MKIKTLSIAFLAAAASLAGCKDTNDAGNEINALAGKATSARIFVTQEVAPGSRSHNGTMTPTAEESKIASAKLFIFDEVRLLEEIVDLEVGTDGLSASKVIQLTTGNKYFYAAINVPATSFSAIAKATSTTSELEKTILSLTDIASAATDNNFWMTNLSVPTAVNLTVATEAEATSGTKNNISINVGRAVAKVGVDFVPTQQFGGVLSNVEYRIRQNPDKMYTVPFVEGGKLKAPYYAESVAGTYFNSSSTFNTAGVTGTPCTALSYAVENSNEVPRKGNASYVSVKGKFTPTEVYNADASATTTLDVDGTFWRIANYDGDPALTTSTFLGYEEKYFGVEPTVTATQAVVKYDQGICYYALWIANNAYTVPTQKYVVERNNYYWINIVSVSGAGSNTEDGVITDPTEELDAETNLKATIVIKDWNPITQNGGI